MQNVFTVGVKGSPLTHAELDANFQGMNTELNAATVAANSRVRTDTASQNLSQQEKLNALLNIGLENVSNILDDSKKLGAAQKAELTALIGAPNGIVPLDAQGQIPVAFGHNLHSPYDISNFINGKPLPNEILLRIISVRAFFCQLNFEGSCAYCTVPSENPFIIDILKNNVQAGTLTFVPGNISGVFSSPTTVTFNKGDQIALRCASLYQDPLLSDIAITIFGSVV